MAEHEYRTVVMKAASIGGKVWSLCVEVQALAERRSPNRKVGQRCPSAPGRGGSYSEGVFLLRKRRYIRGAFGTTRPTRRRSGDQRSTSPGRRQLKLRTLPEKFHR